MADDQRDWHWMDPLIEVYMKDVDQTIIDENLKLTPGQRIANLQSMLQSAERVREAVQNAQRVETPDDNDEL